VVRGHLARLEHCFTAALRTAIRRGEVPASVDPVSRAKGLVATSQGLMVVGKADPDEEVLRAIVESAFAGLIAIDLLFFAANLTKLTHGAWFPLLIGIIAFTIFTTWQRGRELVTQRRVHAEGPLPEFMAQLHNMKPPLHRVPGTAIFLNRGKATAPLAMRANVEHNEILHEHVLILSVETMPAPHIPTEERLQIDDLGYKEDRIVHVTARFGYMDQTNVPDLLPLIPSGDMESPLREDRLSYFVSRIELVQGHAPGMSQWRKRLSIATSRITADAAEYFQLPRERIVIMGSRIEL
jgi:KUP system potassium uptake protein